MNNVYIKSKKTLTNLLLLKIFLSNLKKKNQKLLQWLVLNTSNLNKGKTKLKQLIYWHQGNDSYRPATLKITDTFRLSHCKLKAF